MADLKLVVRDVVNVDSLQLANDLLSYIQPDELRKASSRRDIEIESLKFLYEELRRFK